MATCPPGQVQQIGFNGLTRVYKCVPAKKVTLPQASNPAPILTASARTAWAAAMAPKTYKAAPALVVPAPLAPSGNIFLPGGGTVTDGTLIDQRGGPTSVDTDSTATPADKPIPWIPIAAGAVALGAIVLFAMRK